VVVSAASEAAGAADASEALDASSSSSSSPHAETARARLTIEATVSLSLRDDRTGFPLQDGAALLAARIIIMMI
jgi:hypothetical protein